MNSGELLDKIRDVLSPQCEDASAAVLAVRELLGLLPKSGESVEPIGDFFSEVNRRSRAEGPPVSRWVPAASARELSPTGSAMDGGRRLGTTWWLR